MPKVLIDLRMVQGRLHGIARYALELARRLPALAPAWRFVGLTGPGGLPAGLGDLHPPVSILRCRADYLTPAEQPALLASLVWSRCDLFHATSFSLPALWPGKLVATLHDANHVALPENYGIAQAAYFRLVVRPRAQRAVEIITPSEFSQSELIRYLGLSRLQLRVIPIGVDRQFHPRSPAELSGFIRRTGLPPRYFVAVGNDKPHKNLAFLAELAPFLPDPIVLLAGPGAARRLGFPPNTIEIDELPDEEMPRLFAAATALLFPSLYEGFGLPPLEAMACGCPVIASDVSSIPEVCRDAAILLSPSRLSAWRDAARRIAGDPAFARALSERGIQHAARFSWDLCAQETLAVYEHALGQKTGAP